MGVGEAAAGGRGTGCALAKQLYVQFSVIAYRSSFSVQLIGASLGKTSAAYPSCMPYRGEQVGNGVGLCTLLAGEQQRSRRCLQPLAVGCYR